MGIPSYFSHIIKNYNMIISKPNNIKINNLYMDCNSIIYDIIHNIDSLNTSFEDIYKQICNKLLYYINEINPTNTVFISFDGIAPIAKLSQQRTRRIKNVILKNLTNKIKNTNSNSWDSTQITPGTEFMNSLNIYIKKFFSSHKSNYKVLLSLTDDIGEGEHKLFNYIRNNDHINKTTVIYGLDADLIMLSLLHCKYCNNIYLYRETPQFIKQLDNNLKPSELYLLSINLLYDKITQSMIDIMIDSELTKQKLITDYVFICFMLGNDFIPHNPSINIRTNGIDILIEIYKKYYSENKNKFLINSDNAIEWKHFKKFCKLISDEETNYMIYEYKLKNKFEKKYFPNNTIEQKEYKLNILPSINRDKEHYINPEKTEWENRYYVTLFDIEYNDERIKQVTFNYLEGLEWTWKYYSNKCFDWRWKYNYDYAPLFKDIFKYIPYYNHDFITLSNEPHISYLTQLIYVLPYESHYLLPNKIKNILELKFKKWFDKSNISFKWDYCKYLWESHLILPDININTIEKHILCI